MNAPNSWLGPSRGRPRVSIGMPVYNGERFLTAALESALGQSYTDLELIVSDNASTDDSVEIVRGFAERDPRVRVFRNPVNIGAARNFNRTFGLARGELFTWWAADDLRDPSSVERCVEALDRHSSAVMAFPLARCIDAEGRPLHQFERWLRHQPWSADPAEQFRQLSEEFFETGGVTAGIFIFGLIRADLLRRTRLHGAYVASDWTLLAELALLGRFIELPERALLLREHEESSSRGARRRDMRAVQQFFDPSARGLLAGRLGSARRFLDLFTVAWRAPLPADTRVQLLAYLVELTLRRARRRVGWWIDGTLSPGT